MCESFHCVYFEKWRFTFASGALYMNIFSSPLGMDQNSRRYIPQKTTLGSKTPRSFQTFWSCAYSKLTTPCENRSVARHACVCAYTLNIPDGRSVSRKTQKAQTRSSIRVPERLDCLMGKFILELHSIFEPVSQWEPKLVSCLVFISKQV